MELFKVGLFKVGVFKVLLLVAIALGGLAGCTAPRTVAEWVSLGVDAPTHYWRLERVHDGDTLWVERGGSEEKIRLCGIDAPELGQPLGKTSRDHLRGLVAQSYNGTVGVVPVERDPYGRLVAEIYVPLTADQEISANRQMVMDGMAYVYQRHVGGCPHGNAIAAAEPHAQALAKGIWASDQIPPWQYRQQQS